MHDPELMKIYASGLVEIGKWVSFLILLGAGLSATVVVLVFTKGKQFEIGPLTLNLSKFIYVVMALSAGHLFLTWIFIQRVDQIMEIGAKAATYAWTTLTSSSAFVFFNMQPRQLVDGGWLIEKSYVANSNDTAFWFTTILTIGLVVAVTLTFRLEEKDALITPKLSEEKRVGWLRIETWKQILFYLNGAAIGCGLAALNWLIGSQWAISASSLATGG